MILESKKVNDLGLHDHQLSDRHPAAEAAQPPFQAPNPNPNLSRPRSLIQLPPPRPSECSAAGNGISCSIQTGSGALLKIQLCMAASRGFQVMQDPTNIPDQLARFHWLFCGDATGLIWWATLDGRDFSMLRGPRIDADAFALPTRWLFVSSPHRDSHITSLHFEGTASFSNLSTEGLVDNAINAPRCCQSPPPVNHQLPAQLGHTGLSPREQHCKILKVLIDDRNHSLIVRW